ncbi:hypothetical protein SCP_0407060 [Sparassis crispa]|uniref:Endonuclease/exonuclease/phosphatase domain-containing protein n=1 Tax=Sparassis crispa TaxID=139825 RepID=A0A401GJJ0_9APHY|nr:hypothetical protein SCP_0407060 [Sparassis crispa]GBE82322.1 hypothetical protein SCP_0407060 [Sparassis crispa]
MQIEPVRHSHLLSEKPTSIPDHPPSFHSERPMENADGGYRRSTEKSGGQPFTVVNDASARSYFTTSASSTAPSLVSLSSISSFFLSPLPNHLVLLLFTLLLLLPVVFASNTFNTYALNANGLANVSKMTAITSTISARQPHAWVINETKSSLPHASRVRVQGYSTFEEPGVPISGTRTGKWGVIVGVRDSIHAQRLPTPPQLRGRAVILDLIIPTTTGRGFPYRLIGLYAPWDPGNDELSVSSFWSTITDLCRDAKYSWCILGDCNASISSTETLATSPPNASPRLHYTAFLLNMQAIDLWSYRGDADAHSMFTFKNHLSQSIINRAAHSPSGFVTGTITANDNFIPATDHCAISASLLLAPPATHTGSAVLHDSVPPNDYPPQFYYP